MDSLEFSDDSVVSVVGGDSGVGDPLSALGVLLDELLSGGDDLSGWLLVSGLLDSIWVGNDGLVDLLVDIFTGLCLVGGKALFPLGEMSLELLRVFLLHGVHVGGNMLSEDSVSMGRSVEFGFDLIGILGLSSLVLDDFDSGVLISWESLGLMWDVESSITSSLKGTEASGSSGGSVDTDIEESLEWSLVLNVFVNVEVFTSDIRVGSVHVGETDLLEQSSGKEESGAVSGGIVGKTSGKTVSFELVGLSSTENSISSHGGVDNLGDDLGACSSDDKSVLLGVVLVLLLTCQSSSGIVVSLSLSSSLWLDLHSHGVCLVLDDLHETHC